MVMYKVSCEHNFLLFDYSKSKPNRFAELKIDEFRKISLSTKSTKKSCFVRVFRVFRGQKNKHE